MAGGGYLIDSLPQLVTVSADGQLSDSPIPVGYIVSGPTSDPNVFILRRDDRKTAPERMQGPHPAYLWRKGNAAPSSLPGLVDEIVPAAAPNLTWVRDSTAAWSLVDQLGVAKLEFRSLPPWDGEPDATGKYVVEQSGRSQGCEHDVPPTCSVRLVEHATGSLLAQVNVGSNSGFFWSGSSVAFSPTTGDPVAQPAASAIVVLSPTGASQVQLPPVR